MKQFRIIGICMLLHGVCTASMELSNIFLDQLNKPTAQFQLGSSPSNRLVEAPKPESPTSIDGQLSIFSVKLSIG